MDKKSRRELLDFILFSIDLVNRRMEGVTSAPISWKVTTGWNDSMLSVCVSKVSVKHSKPS
ncbi:hypothetical protein [Hydrogenimonas sp.]